MSEANELLKNLDKLHTTELGVVRIKKNLSLDTDDVVGWCREKINSDKSVITRNGKNWYVDINACIITVNAYSYVSNNIAEAAFLPPASPAIKKRWV